jgi:Cytochrome P450
MTYVNTKNTSKSYARKSKRSSKKVAVGRETHTTSSAKWTASSKNPNALPHLLSVRPFLSSHLSPRLTFPQVSFNRIALKPLTLSSGIEIPAGTHFSVASRDILFDPDVTPNPNTFDGLRYYQLRRTASRESHKHDFASADGANMSFGAGRYACPGRFFASMELKLLLAQLLLQFDFRFPPGAARPSLLVLDEFVAPIPWAKVMVRRRKMKR